jgi:uncharacterized protein
MIFDPENLAIAMNSMVCGEPWTGSYAVSLADHEWDIPEASPGGEPGSLSLRVTSSRDSIVVEGTLSATFLFQCSRCLQQAAIPIEGEIRRVYTSDQMYADEPDVEPISHKDGWISILAAVREAVILAMPMVPLCSPGCGGLCSVCGANLNNEKCVHVRGDESPPSASKE